jgi:hypothetical protein
MSQRRLGREIFRRRAFLEPVTSPIAPVVFSALRGRPNCAHGH